ncbi:MAG: hypothetical protein M3Y91_19435 [Actinomycetota bacterium]|nr:hypothetical protein [Actinomycetota bacterium]
MAAALTLVRGSVVVEPWATDLPGTAGRGAIGFEPPGSFPALTDPVAKLLATLIARAAAIDAADSAA